MTKLVIPLLVLMVGCDSMGTVDINELHDDRTTQGCVAVAADGKTKWTASASGELVKVFCSKELPPCFNFHYDRNGFKVDLITECPYEEVLPSK